MRASSAASLAGALACALLAGCAGQKGGARTGSAYAPVRDDAQVPAFARKPYEPISRAAVVAIALREWRLFGQPVDDDPPGTRPRPLPDEKPERQPGLWQRVGEYWWTALGPDDKEGLWTGKHDEFGLEFDASQDGGFAWSAAFISYVMRVAGAGAAFPYSGAHSDYINVARQMADGQTAGYLVTAARPEAYAPQPGDLICEGRGRAHTLRYDDLPTPGHFPGHCDIVVQAAPGALSVIGGNVDDAVTMKHVPVTPDGKLAEPDGTVLDTRYPWMVVLRVLYPAAPGTPVS
jgi:hypothetical protein